MHLRRALFTCAFEACVGCLLDYFGPERMWEAASDAQRFDVMLCLLERADVIFPASVDHRQSPWKIAYDKRLYDENVTAGFGEGGWCAPFYSLAHDAMNVAIKNQEPEQVLHLFVASRRWKLTPIQDEHVKQFVRLNWEDVMVYLVYNSRCRSVRFGRENWFRALRCAIRLGRTSIIRIILDKRPNYVDVQDGRLLKFAELHKQFHIVRLLSCRYGARV